MRNPLRGNLHGGICEGRECRIAMVDLNGHEAGNGGHSQGTPPALRPLFYSERWLFLAESHLTQRLFGGARCEGLRRSHHQQDRRAVDRNRFRCQSRLEKEKCLRNGFEKPNFGLWYFPAAAEKALHSKS